MALFVALGVDLHVAEEFFQPLLGLFVHVYSKGNALSFLRGNSRPAGLFLPSGHVLICREEGGGIMKG